MAYNGGKEIQNTFNLQLQNLNGESELEVNLFNLGTPLVAPITTPKPTTFTTAEAAQIMKSMFTYSPTPPITNADIKIFKTGTSITIKNADGDEETHTGFTAYTDNLNDVNDALKTMTSTSGQWYSGISVYFVFDFALYRASASEGASIPLVAYVLYSDDFDMNTLSNKGIVEISMDNTLAVKSTAVSVKNLIPAWKTGEKNAGSGVLITPRNGIGYGEIVESQNGQVLDIKAMNFTIIGGDAQQEQIYNCFTFEKTDINGNKIEYKKCPVVDVYSNPNINSIDDIQLERKADVYTLDGTTNLNYTLGAGIIMQLGAEYTKLTNLLQESKKGQEQIMIQKRNIQKNRLNTGYALSKEAVTEENQKNQKEFNFSGGDVKKKVHLQHYATLSLYLEGWHYSY